MYEKFLQGMMNFADGQVLLSLEGGYKLDQIGPCAAACAHAMLGNSLDEIE